MSMSTRLPSMARAGSFVAQQSANDEVLCAIAERQTDLAARCETESLGKFLGENDGGGIDQQVEKFPGAGFALLPLKLQQAIVAKRAIRKNVDSQHTQKLICPKPVV